MQDIHPKTVSESLDTLIKNIIKPYMSRNNHEIIIYSMYVSQQKYAKINSGSAANIYTRSVAFFSWKRLFFALTGNPFPSHFVFLFLGWEFFRCAKKLLALSISSLPRR